MENQNMWQEKIRNYQDRSKSIYFIIVLAITFAYRIFKYGTDDPIVYYLQLIIGGACIVNIFTYLAVNYKLRNNQEYQRFKKNAK